MPFIFIPEQRPLPLWQGPFSPSYGTYSGFRVNRGRLGTWVETATDSSFWMVEPSQGSEELSAFVQREWGGGRVLLLPNGFAVKPLHSEDRSLRVLIGHFRGFIILVRPDGTRFDMGHQERMPPGSSWPGPRSTGLECAIRSNGSLTCSWFRHSRSGNEYTTKELRGPDKALAAGFRAARPGEIAGRVRITANGAVITNRRFSDAAWNALYIGTIDPESWPEWGKWIDRVIPGKSALSRTGTENPADVLHRGSRVPQSRRR